MLSFISCVQAYMPFGAALKIADYEPSSKFPKLAALADRTQAADGVGEYAHVHMCMCANCIRACLHEDAQACAHAIPGCCDCVMTKQRYNSALAIPPHVCQ